MDKLISIVVPAYNVEKYIGKCIESLMNQTYQNIEIIIIDDGSSDNTAQICDDYAYKDNRIKVVHRENMGVSAARNYGIEISKGEFVAFIDSDDFVSKIYCEKMISAISRNNAEVAICCMHDYEENKKIEVEEKEYVEEVLNPEETIIDFIKTGKYFDCMGGKMLSRRLINMIKFPINRIYEDCATVYKFYTNANRSVVLNQEYYFYLVHRNGSITSSIYDEKHQHDYDIMMKERYDYLVKHFPDLKEWINALLIMNMFLAIQRAYMTEKDELINSEVIKEYDTCLENYVSGVDKNVLYEVLHNNYWRSALFMYLQDKEFYKDNMKKLYLTRNEFKKSNSAIVKK